MCCCMLTILYAMKNWRKPNDLQDGVDRNKPLKGVPRSMKSEICIICNAVIVPIGSIVGSSRRLSLDIRFCHTQWRAASPSAKFVCGWSMDTNDTGIDIAGIESNSRVETVKAQLRRLKGTNLAICDLIIYTLVVKKVTTQRIDRTRRAVAFSSILASPCFLFFGIPIIAVASLVARSVIKFPDTAVR